MAATRELGGPLVVDVNENEEDKARRLKCVLALRQGDVSAGHQTGGDAAEVNGTDDMPDLTARSLPATLTCDDHLGLNGTTESRCDQAVVGGGGVEGGGPGLAASCPAVTAATSRHTRKNGTSGADLIGSVNPAEEATDGDAGLPCSGTGLRKSMSTEPQAGMPNGDVDGPDQCGGPLDLCGPHMDRCGPHVDHWTRTLEARGVNGGFHACKEAQSDVWSSGDCSVGLAGLPASVDSPDPKSSARPLSPGPSASSGLSEDSSPSEEDSPGPSLVVRPRSLRTDQNLTVSRSCDATPLSPTDEGGFCFGDEGDFRNIFEAGRRQSAPDQLPDLNVQLDCSESRLTSKKFGIADFFTRGLFSRKAKESKALSHNASGWRLFGRPREEDATKDSAPSSTEQCPLAAGRRKNLEFEPLSTTALILEDRPPNLPAKSVEETQRHKLEYEEMVAGAKRRELKEAQKKKRQMKERHRHEDSISNAMVVWNTQILPHWDTMKGTRRVRELWWQGLPPSVRGRVWSLAIGNELNITAELYDIFLCRAKEKWRSYSETSSVNDSESDGGASLADRESSLDLIKLDISRTFPSLFIFQKGGPYHDLLHSVLGAYTCYRPDIGYVQGMSFIAAVLILNLEEAEAFITFANLLNKPCQMAFFRVDHELMLKYFAVFEVFFEENLPRLFSHFQTSKLTPDLYLIDWIFTLYSKSLPLDVACRVWDVFCRDGEESLFRTGLGILRLFEDVLLQMDFIHIAQFLSRLPEDLQAHTLFAAMASTHMISRNRRWAQVFSSLPTRDKSKEADKNGSPALRS
ncbi:TBC1 domain family member 12-like [Dunckerocampus dactyliophorus]|uniref:TBC1 domain family member 12-like n=1 Tax=Dunckerocampus dactyliophorus TaxID=161453 RepID=UPI002405A184|nr:TBC1 domain family member 12-like [Dunckerocampus dactyliophorus]XP_054654862.1 TBC1 domain family member 12-like [Dunckerocampus dactyliophorus]XP_054654864.1 TBC1 domain family member 12-like [Dunckerocampus dactyliophorus]